MHIKASAIEKVLLFGDSLMAGYGLPKEHHLSPVLQNNLEELHIVAKGLLEYETLTGDEIKDLIKGIKPSRDDFDDDSNPKDTPTTTSVPKTSNNISPQTQ